MTTGVRIGFAQTVLCIISSFPYLSKQSGSELIKGSSFC